MIRDLDSYPLSPKQLQTLKYAGFTQNINVIELSPSQLSEGIIFSPSVSIFQIFDS